MNNDYYTFGKIADGLFLNRLERELRQEHDRMSTLKFDGKIEKHPVNIAELQEKDLDIIAVYFGSAISSADENYAERNLIFVDYFSNCLQHALNIRSKAQNALADVPMTLVDKTPARDEFQGILRLRDKFSINNLALYRLAVVLYRRKD